MNNIKIQKGSSCQVCGYDMQGWEKDGIMKHCLDSSLCAEHYILWEYEGLKSGELIKSRSIKKTIELH